MNSNPTACELADKLDLNAAEVESYAICPNERDLREAAALLREQAAELAANARKALAAINEKIELQKAILKQAARIEALEKALKPFSAIDADILRQTNQDLETTYVWTQRCNPRETAVISLQHILDAKEATQ